MTMVLIEVPDEAAVQVLSRQKGVRVVQIIAAGQRVVEVPAPTAEAPETPPKRAWAGSLAAVSTTTAEEWDAYLRETRNEWERSF